MAKTRNPLSPGFWLVAGLALLSVLSAPAGSPTITVRPRGANQVDLTATSLETNVSYFVMVRTNSPEGHWLGLTWILGGSNSTATVLCDLGGSQAPAGLTTRNLAHWTFVVGSGEDSDGNGLPDVYEDLVTRSDPYCGADPYGDPDGDGWVTIQEMQNGTDPLRFDRPPPPSNVEVSRYTNGITRLTWNHSVGALLDYFVVEKAQRTLHPGTNVGPFLLQPPSPLSKTNLGQYLARQREIQRRFGQPFSRRHDAFYVTGDYQVVARIPARPGQHDYSYTETNPVSTPWSDPVYRVQSHYTPPLQAYLERVNPTSIHQTVLPVAARPTTNGFDLTASNPIPHAWYLLLVRDRNNPQWRGSGYFASGTNRDPVHLHVDSKGMMHEGQSPIAMPDVKFVPDVVAPEFTAGWGEDSDGDGLPDIYEVLVTKTDPAAGDTGNTGILDGYKELARDGWSNLEKFRRRANPFEPNLPPPPLELQRPTLLQVWQALASRTPKTDLHYQPQITVRKPGEVSFHPEVHNFGMLNYTSKSGDPRSTPLDCDVRIEWRPPRPHPPRAAIPGPDALPAGCTPRPDPPGIGQETRNGVRNSASVQSVASC